MDKKIGFISVREGLEGRESLLVVCLETLLDVQPSLPAEEILGMICLFCFSDSYQ